MRLAIHHETLYRYADQVRASIQYLRLTPQGDARQTILDWELSGYFPAYWEYVKAMRRPDCGSQWIKSKSVDRVLKPYLK